jgi:hypothetical protein
MYSRIDRQQSGEFVDSRRVDAHFRLNPAKVRFEIGSRYVDIKSWKARRKTTTHLIICLKHQSNTTLQ